VPWQQHTPGTLYGQLAGVQGSALPQQPRRTLSHHHSPAPILHETCHAFLEARCAPPVRPSLAAAPLRHRRNHLHKHPPAFAPREPIASQQPQSQSQRLLTVVCSRPRHLASSAARVVLSPRCLAAASTTDCGCRNFPLPPADSQPLTTLAVSYETARTNLNSALLCIHKPSRLASWVQGRSE
jgi:hypothetical protein